jgi:MraZ protein
LTFRGTFDHSLDAKHRLTVPAKFRGALANGAVLAVSPETTPGTPRSISIWPPDAFDAFADASLAGLNPLSARARELKRLLNNNSHDVELDSANRVMIPASLIRYAGLGKDVVVTGSGECLELWDRAAYTAYNEGALARFPDLADSVGDTA